MVAYRQRPNPRFIHFEKKAIKSMLKKLKLFKERHPFTSLMLVAITVRIIVVIFVPGFGSNRALQHPTLFIGFLDKVKSLLSIGQSQGMMLLSRSLYAAVSLFTVSMIYRISDLGSNNKQNAWLMGLFPALCCVMPAFGVIENASAFLGLPLVLYGCNVVLRQEVLRQANFTENVHRTSFLIAGLVLGFGACVWYESVFIIFTLLVILCLRRNAKGALMTLIGTIASIVAVGLLLWILSVNPLKYIQL